MAAGRLDFSRIRGRFGYSREGFVDGYKNSVTYGLSARNSDFVRWNGSRCRERQELEELWGRKSCLTLLEDGEIPKVEDEVHLHPEKKRKFSPIEWDLEDKTGRHSDDGVVKSSAISSPPLQPEKHWADKQNDCWAEEEVSEAQNISMSRWASDSDSPRDSTLTVEEDASGDTVFRKKSCSESENLQKQVLDRSRSRSRSRLRSLSQSPSSRGRDCNVSSSSRYADPENRFGNDVVTNVDEVEHEDKQMDFGDVSDENQPASAVQSRVNMLQGCRSVFEYERLNEINEGTYGKVYKARDLKTGEHVALKKVKMGVGRDRKLDEYGFPLTSLREINILMSLNHPSIVNVKEVVMGNLDSVFMVMEYMEHDLKDLMQVMKQPFSTSEVKCLMLQLLEGVKYLHDNWVLHRDLKTSNLLLNNQGELKICDFGMARQYGSPLKPYTSLVVTLWYRAPELLLGAKQYSTAVDMWSVGCIMAEMLTKEPLFKGSGEIDQLDKIFKILGTPNETIWPGLSKLPGATANFVKQPYNLLRKKFPATSFTGSPVLSDTGLDLLNKLLTYDPEKRISADAALNHPWFQEVPLPKSKDFMPTFPSQYVKKKAYTKVDKHRAWEEQQRRKRHHLGLETDMS